MFRRRHRKDEQVNSKTSLAEAQAARDVQQNKTDAERPLASHLDRLIRENHLSALFREALGAPGREP